MKPLMGAAIMRMAEASVTLKRASVVVTCRSGAASLINENTATTYQLNEIPPTTRMTTNVGTDGTSSTLLISEVLTRAHTQDQRGVWALPWTGSSQLAFDMHDEVDPVNFSSGGYSPDPRSLGLTQPPNNRGPNTDMLYACPDPVGAQLERMPCNVYERGTPRDYLSAAPRSQHPGGVNVVYADGHVAFLNDGVDQLTMAYLIHISDGMALDLANSGL